MIKIMRIPRTYLYSIAGFIMAIFLVVGLTLIAQLDYGASSPTQYPGPEYWKGVPLSAMGLELVPLSHPVRISEGPYLKMVQTIGVRGGINGIPYTVDVIWSEPVGDSWEIVERYGPIDGNNFSAKEFVTQPDGAKTFNPSATSGVHNLYLGYMDQSVNTREIWFKARNEIAWTDAEIVSDPEVDSRSWGARVIPFFEEKTGYELPIVLWFDHRFTQHEILMKSRGLGVGFLGPGKGGFVFEKSWWHPYIRITNDYYYQFEPNTDWSSGYGDLQENVIHLVYMDSRYSGFVDEQYQRNGNCEIFYREIRPLSPLVGRDANGDYQPVEQEWEVGPEIKLTIDPAVDDYPAVCGRRFSGNTEMHSAIVAWQEHDAENDTYQIQQCGIEDSTPGEIRRLTPPGFSAIHPDLANVPITGHEGLAVIAYSQFKDGQKFPGGSAQIYIRVIDGDKISEPIMISDSKFACGYGRVKRVGFRLEEEATIITGWSEEQTRPGDSSAESQVFYRAFKLRETG